MQQNFVQKLIELTRVVMKWGGNKKHTTTQIRIHAWKWMVCATVHSYDSRPYTKWHKIIVQKCNWNEAQRTYHTKGTKNDAKISILIPKNENALGSENCRLYVLSPLKIGPYQNMTKILKVTWQEACKLSCTFSGFLDRILIATR